VASRVSITTASVHRAMHTPGGVVHKFNTQVGREVVAVARVKSPVNNRLNQLHREKWGHPHKPGDYKKSWAFHNTTGTNQHSSKVLIENTASHAVYVELGRSESTKYQVFSWSRAPMLKGRKKWKRGAGWKFWLVTAGGPNSTFKRTRFRSGRHILRDSARMVLGRYGIPFS
jgi:hypothetical protein